MTEAESKAIQEEYHELTMKFLEEKGLEDNY